MVYGPPMRRGVRLPVFLALGGIAWAGAHWLAHRSAGGGSPSAHAGAHGSPGLEAAELGYLTTSLTLCLSLSLVLAGIAVLDPRMRMRRARSLWLFGAVPVLGLFGELLAASGWTLAGAAGIALELAPLALVVAGVQLGVAVVALRVADGILGLAESVARAVVGPRPALASFGRGVFAPSPTGRAPALRLALGGGQRAPPASLPAS